MTLFENKAFKILFLLMLFVMLFVFIAIYLIMIYEPTATYEQGYVSIRLLNNIDVHSILKVQL